MKKDEIKVLNLGEFSDEERELLQKDKRYTKQINDLKKEAQQAAKRETCFYCEKEVESFCNSHSVPKFCLKNITIDGHVHNLNFLIENPVLSSEDGLNIAGTFHIICRDCDNTIFKDYEEPNNYDKAPTPKMISQIALKNYLRLISKRLFEKELYEIYAQKSSYPNPLFEGKPKVNELDLREFVKGYKKAKKSAEKNSSNDYYVCYYEKLSYVTPIAFQGAIALIFDFEGNVINNIHNYSTEYEIKYIHLCVFPLKSETVLLMFIENNEKRYRQFYKQFAKLSTEDKLAAMTFMMFAYSEDVYFSKNIRKEVTSNKSLRDIGKSGTDILATTPYFDSIEVIRESFCLDKRHDIPNLLSEEFKLR